MSHRNVPKRASRFSLLVSLLVLALLSTTLTTAMAANDGGSRRTAASARPQLTFTVNSTGDGHDSNTADNVCDDGTGDCTLRAAIEQANATSGADNIRFEFKDGSVQTINVGLSGNGALPAITDPVSIIGTPQPNCSGICIELNGSSAGAGANGLRISSGSSLVRGLSINQFNGNGILIDGAGGNRVDYNLIGTDITGMIARRNQGAGIKIDNSPDNVIGEPYYGNTLSGNTSGVTIVGSNAIRNIVQSNSIGVSRSGESTIGNISNGVTIVDASHNRIGGTDYATGNTISSNGLDGVHIASGVRNRILGNLISANGRLGIDLVAASDPASGVTPNDQQDPDTGANKLQNHPLVTEAVSASRMIRGRLNSRPNHKFRIEFFANPRCDPSNHGEGARYLGYTTTQTDSTGHATFIFYAYSYGYPFGYGFAAGQFITATATDSGGNTSEFSICKKAT